MLYGLSDMSLKANIRCGCLRNMKFVGSPRRLSPQQLRNNPINSTSLSRGTLEQAFIRCKWPNIRGTQAILAILPRLVMSATGPAPRLGPTPDPRVARQGQSPRGNLAWGCCECQRFSSPQLKDVNSVWATKPTVVISSRNSGTTKSQHASPVAAKRPAAAGSSRARSASARGLLAPTTRNE